MLKIKTENLNTLYNKISNSLELYLPIKKANAVNFGLWQDGEQASLSTLKTVKSPKDLFFPQTEDIMKFKTEGKNISIIDIRKPEDEFVLFGIKACDYKAIEVLDKVFLADPVDTYYKAKRDAVTIVTLACSRPEESCFCKVFGIDATNPQGDVTTWIEGDELFWQANTEKGNALTEKVKDLLTECDDKVVKAQQQKTKEIIEKLPFSNLDLSYFEENGVNDIFNRPEWQQLSESCLACGTCTFVCPTCQCFDVKDYKTNKGIIRYRCWDSCMYSDFTQMSHGSNRTTQMQRYRQRFMHKLKYYPENNDGTYSCVGCGRCVNKCPQRLNIVKVIKTLGGKN